MWKIIYWWPSVFAVHLSFQNFPLTPNPRILTELFYKINLLLPWAKKSDNQGQNLTNQYLGHEKGSSINDVSVLRGRGQGFSEDSIKASVIISVTMGGGGGISGKTVPTFRDVRYGQPLSQPWFILASNWKPVDSEGWLSESLFVTLPRNFDDVRVISFENRIVQSSERKLEIFQNLFVNFFNFESSFKILRNYVSFFWLFEYVNWFLFVLVFLKLIKDVQYPKWKSLRKWSCWWRRLKFFPSVVNEGNYFTLEGIAENICILTWNCWDALLQLSILAMYKATALIVLLRQSLEQKKTIFLKITWFGYHPNHLTILLILLSLLLLNIQMRRETIFWSPLRCILLKVTILRHQVVTTRLIYDFLRSSVPPLII